MSEALLTRVRQAIARHQLLAGGSRVVVAVSGGADSVALLHVLRTLQPVWRLTLHLAHLDHGLRPESAQDAEFVKRLGLRWQIPATIERQPVGAICAEAGWSLEDGSRRIRYQFLLKVARGQGATHLALAHTADDQAETVLMRLVRGTGLLGLGAIPWKRPVEDPQGKGRQVEVWVVRPFLEVWRREILAYLTQEHLSFQEDATNTDPRFVRNRIRHHLLPLLERDYNPNIKGTLTQLAEQSHWDYAYLQEAAGRQWKRLVKTRAPAQVAISVSVFLRQPKAIQRQLVRRAIQRVRGDLGQVEFRHWLEVERLFMNRPLGAIVDLPGGVQVRREANRVVYEITPRAPQPLPFD